MKTSEMWSVEEIVNSINKTIVKFFSSHNGYSNGYSTFVEGEVCDTNGCALKWATPTMGDLTINEVRAIGIKLHSDIRNFVPKSFFDEHTITITSKHVEDGCYSTYINIIRTFEVQRWNIENG
jgi:hypothetical protein